MVLCAAMRCAAMRCDAMRCDAMRGDAMRCAGLNGSETFVAALANIVKGHLDRRENFSAQYRQKCLTCTKPLCRKIINPAFRE
jgi:hypothetical protein